MMAQRVSVFWSSRDPGSKQDLSALDHPVRSSLPSSQSNLEDRWGGHLGKRRWVHGGSVSFCVLYNLCLWA